MLNLSLIVFIVIFKTATKLFWLLITIFWYFSICLMLLRLLDIDWFLLTVCLWLCLYILDTTCTTGYQLIFRTFWCWLWLTFWPLVVIFVDWHHDHLIPLADSIGCCWLFLSFFIYAYCSCYFSCIFGHPNYYRLLYLAA